MRLAIVTALVACVLWSAHPAAAAQIGVYNDAGGLLCPQAQPFTPTTWYALALLAPDACLGISGAEFRIGGVPTAADGWFVQVIAPPDVAGIGDPFAEGPRFNFPLCQFSESGVVLLFTMRVIQLSGTPVLDRPVQILAHQTPADPLLDCPVLRLCDAPALTGICAGSAPTRINGFGFCPCQDCSPATCPPLAVEAAAWSTVKQLFR